MISFNAEQRTFENCKVGFRPVLAYKLRGLPNPIVLTTHSADWLQSLQFLCVCACVRLFSRPVSVFVELLHPCRHCTPCGGSHARPRSDALTSDLSGRRHVSTAPPLPLHVLERSNVREWSRRRVVGCCCCCCSRGGVVNRLSARDVPQRRFLSRYEPCVDRDPILLRRVHARSQ